MPIEILSEQLASKIAAGEVVERPASVVKELVENAIDAGATTINVDIRGDGRQLIQISDDGEGISAAEMETAFQRHATSKLQSAADLEGIRTLGFRGEALAAIASVSQLTAVSRAEGETAGTRLVLEGGIKSSRESVGAPQGTVIAVANLFYNVPARHKFLKSKTTEKRLVDEHVTRYALAYPKIRFRLTHDGRITFQSSGNGSLVEVLTAVYGPDTAKTLLEISEQTADENQGAAETATVSSQGTNEIARKGSFTVSGYVGPPSLHWSSRKHITLFVNGRWIKDNRLTYAVIQAYHTLLPTGRYPLAVVFLSVPVTSVDVNVHPAKTEVRFRQGDSAFGIIQRSVRQTLISDSPIPHASHFTSFQTPGWSGNLERHAFGQRQDETSQRQLGLDWSSTVSLGTTGDSEEVEAPGEQLEGDSLPIVRVIGQVGASYIITEGPDGLYLIDQHAAHERILYEKFMAAREEGAASEIAAQGLVNGATVHLLPSQATLLSEQLDLLIDIGFEIEPFGPNVFMVRSVPALLTNLDPVKALVDVVEDLERGEAPMQRTMESRIILRVCKSAAVKAGQTLSRTEMEAMIRQLEKCQNPHTCPHGRPTLIHLSAAQLAREFGRI